LRRAQEPVSLRVAYLLLAPVAIVILLWAITPLVDAYRRRALRRCLPGVCGVLNSHGIDYWCDFGSLLGYHRDGDVIWGDKDADLCIHASEKENVMRLEVAFGEAGYWLTDKGGDAKKLVRVYDRRTNYYVDIYPFDREGEMLRSVLSAGDDVPARLVARRVEAPFLGGTIRVPEDVEALVAYRYGPDYRTPRRGDKGRSRKYNLLRSWYEDMEANVLDLGSFIGLRRPPAQP
jgi:hypothetical protein